MGAISTIRSMAPAVMISLLPKTAGSIARVSDERYAPKKVRQVTAMREAATLSQVAVYSALIDRSVKGLKLIAHRMSQSGEKNLLTDSIEKLGKNEPLFLAGLAFTSNISAEMISRKMWPRNVWARPQTDKREKACIEASLIDEIQGKPVPVDIEICQLGPARHSSRTACAGFILKPQPLRHQPVAFASRPAATTGASPVVNPFQTDALFSPVARPAFSV